MPPPLLLFMAAITLCIGIAVLSANPARFTNQIFFFASLLIALNTWFVVRATMAGILFRQGLPANPVLWLRANAVITAFVPWTIWLLKESLVAPQRNVFRTFRQSLPWLGLGVIISIIATTNWYIPAESVPLHEKRGLGYIVNNVALWIAFAHLNLRTLVQLQYETGIRRIELQFIVLNLGLAALGMITLYTLGNLFQIILFKRAGVVIVPISYALTALALSFYRVFDVRQVFLPLGQRLVLALLLGFGALAIWTLLESQFPSPLDLVLSIALISTLAFPLDRVLRRWLRLGDDGPIAGWREAVIQVARGEPDTEKLLLAFEELLCMRCDSPSSKFLYIKDDSHAGGTLALSHARLGYETLCKLGWATPESLQRRRVSQGTDDLRQFLTQNSLGILLTVPRGSPTPSLILAVGAKRSQWPFTYPEVQQIQNLAELMDNILTHSRLTSQAAMKAKMEHLALMSRGLAHDLKNLITPVSTFIMHAEAKVDPNGDEGEVHRAAKRSLHLMNDYVRDALFFASRLKPNFEQTPLRRVFETVRELTAPRAAQRGVEVVIDVENSFSLTADTVLLQRLLANLVNNAIDASRPGGKVVMTCSSENDGIVRLEVADEGSGISAENLKRIFDPYFTTKQFGDEIRGFGLGLTICEKIVDLHLGKITVRSEVDRGTRVLVELPAMPSAFGVPLDAAATA